MSDNKRAEEIKASLKKDIYSELNNLDYLEDDTFASTQKLANILDGYMTKVDDLGMDDEQEELEFLDEIEVNIEANDDHILTEYNAKLHDFSLDTLNDILHSDYVVEDKEVEATDTMDEDVASIIDSIEDTKHDMYNKDIEIIEPTEDLVTLDELDEIDLDDKPVKEDFTQTIVSPHEICNIDTMELEDSILDEIEDDHKLTKLDYALYSSIAILVVIIIYIFVGGK